MRRAVIDIGTNTVKLLVADVQAGVVTPVREADVTTRLGEGVDKSKRLSRVAIARTVEAIDQFATEAKGFGATGIIALTTSAARDAANRDEFLDGVRCKCGLAVLVISGEREAELIFGGVSSDPVWASRPLFVLDVGGGSAEIIQGEAGKIERFQSLPLGAVRLTEQFGDDFPGLCQHLRITLHRILKSYDVAGRKMIGTGGTITTLANVVHSKVDHDALTQGELRAWVAKLNAMTQEDRKKVPGLPPERADIIVAGSAVFMVAMELLGAQELTVSVRNLRYGALVERL